MGQQPLAVSPEDLAKSGEHFRSIGDTAWSIGQEMFSGLRAVGNFWGDDPTGRLFSEQWEPATKGIQDLLYGFHDNMKLTNINLLNTALSYAKANKLGTELAHPVKVR